MTRAEFFRALESPILSYFPYEVANDDDFDQASENIGFRFNK